MKRPKNPSSLDRARKSPAGRKNLGRERRIPDKIWMGGWKNLDFSKGKAAKNAGKKQNLRGKKGINKGDNKGRDGNLGILGFLGTPTVGILGICILGDAVQVVGAVLQVAGSLREKNGQF